MNNYQWELYKVDQQITEVLDIQAENGLPDDDIKDMLEMLKMDQEDIIEQVGLEYKNLESQTEILKSEMDRLKDRREAAKARMERLKKILSAWCDGKKFETPKVKISFRKSEETVIDEFEALESEYVRVKYEPDKTAIKKAIKDGREVTGAHLEEKIGCSIK